MESATEAELAAPYINACEAIYIRIILEELGHKQPATPLQTNNAMADAVCNRKTSNLNEPRPWICDSIGFTTANAKNNSEFTGNPASFNYADYWTKHHPAKHHQNIRRVSYSLSCFRNVTHPTETSIFQPSSMSTVIALARV